MRMYFKLNNIIGLVLIDLPFERLNIFHRVFTE